MQWLNICIALSFLTAFVNASTNVYGETLQPCSSSGMALTGYTREGDCSDHQQDTGSHHICIDLSNTAGGNFCGITGQPNWCASSMACHDDASRQCPVQHWWVTTLGIVNSC
jgi:Uncharacterized protein conserved in bacteria (DUF2237)